MNEDYCEGFAKFRRLRDEEDDRVMDFRGLTRAEAENIDSQFVSRGLAVTGDPVEHPLHYRGAVECIDVIEDLGLGYNLGCVLKYVWRADRKGQPVEDLRKAKWYLEREIERRVKG